MVSKHQETKNEAELARFWEVICAEVDLRIGDYRIGTMTARRITVWFAIRDGEPAPVGQRFDTRQQAIDWALAVAISER